MSFKVMGMGSRRDWEGIVEFLECIWRRALGNLKAVLEARSQT